MIVKRLTSLLLTIAILCTMAISSATAATDSVESTGAYYNYGKYADQTYDGEDLGFTYTPSSTTWKVWSPAAESVQVKLYKTGTDRENGAGVIGIYDLAKSDDFASNGVWEVTLQGDYKNVYYTYLVKAANTHGVVETNETQDIYSKAVGANGDRSMVVDLNDTDPEGWDDDKHVVFDDITKTTVWELHIRDFSCDPESGISEENQGNYLAFTEGGTKLKTDSSEKAVSTGIDYLVEQGVNCVQLMPFADYDQVDEITGATATKRNWGYNPKNYNVPDGSYSSDAYDGNVRINEVKQMIQALHDRGISVIMDVVYNHTAGYEASCFTKTVPGYYYRMSGQLQYVNGSGQGCELASENEMVRNFIIQSMKYWVEEYHIDGFRFDLMACMDITTLNNARTVLNNLYADGSGAKIPMYGEPWPGGDTACMQAPFQSNASKLMSGIGMFSASMRDTATNIESARGGSWVTSGDTSKTSEVVKGIMADHVSADNTQTVTYAECHDKLTLWDKITGAYTLMGEGKESKTTAENVNSTDEKYTDRLKLGGALFTTSQGIVFLQAGTEFARTKQGQMNSYNSSDEINQLDWSRVPTYSNVVEYYKGLNRIHEVYSPFSDDTEASEDTMNFISNTDNVIAYTIDNVTENKDNEWGKVAVLLNSGETAQTIDLGASGWEVIANADVAGLASLETVSGSSYTVDARSAAILVESSTYKDFSENFKFGTLTTNHYVGSELVKTTTAKYRIGSKYHALQDKELLIGHDLVSTEGETSGNFDGDKVVNYTYAEKTTKTGKLKVNYVDRDGFSVAPSMEYILEDGEYYSIPVCAVQGYQLNTNKYPSGTTGTFDGVDKTINFVYKELESQVVKMHYYNHYNWRTVLCYAYTDDGDEPLGAWSANRNNTKAMMKDDGDGWFSIEIPVSSCKVMFYSINQTPAQEPGQNEPGYPVSGECWIENKIVTYSSTIIVSCIDIESGAKFAEDVVTTEVKKSTEEYTTTTDNSVGTLGELVATPANASGFYQPGVTNVVYLYKGGLPIPTTEEPPVDYKDRYVLGDSNCDGKVNINDVTFIQQYLVNLVFFDDYNVRNGDVDKDYKVTIKDASYIQRYLVGLEDTYGIARYYDVNDYQKPTEEVEEDDNKVRALFTDNKGWSNQGDLTCYYWIEGDYPVAWPGEKMEFVGTNEYGEDQYEIAIPQGYNFIVTNNVVQTVDLTLNGQTGFYIGTKNAEGKYTCNSW